MCIPASERPWPCWQTRRGGTTVISIVAAAAFAVAAHVATLCTRASFGISLSPSLCQSLILGLTLGLSLSLSLSLGLGLSLGLSPSLSLKIYR